MSLTLKIHLNFKLFTPIHQICRTYGPTYFRINFIQVRFSTVYDNTLFRKIFSRKDRNVESEYNINVENVYNKTQIQNKSSKAKSARTKKPNSSHQQT